MKLREKRISMIKQQLRPIAPVVRSWFLNEGYSYIRNNKMTNAEEEFLEKISNHYLEAIDRLEGVGCLRK